jgi:ABC-type antimicrobial peptide transport system permease subunit
VQPLGGFAGIDALPVQRPAEIVNSSQMGAAPVVLGGALALGAAASLGLALAAAVRQRRRELTLLKTLGFTRRQLAATVAWQATATTALALAVGVPIGVLAGRRLWTAFAHQLDVVTQPASPARALLLIVLAALAVANLVAAAPARAARNVRASTLLRAE